MPSNPEGKTPLTAAQRQARQRDKREREIRRLREALIYAADGLASERLGYLQQNYGDVLRRAIEEC